MIVFLSHRIISGSSWRNADLKADIDIRDMRAEEVMTQAPVACRGDDDLQRALDSMQKDQVTRIPVIAENQELIGISLKRTSPFASASRVG